MTNAHANDILIAGWAHSTFGKHPAGALEELIQEVALGAIAAAGLEPRHIDEIVLGQFNSGLLPFSFPASLPLQAHSGLWGIPATRVENACASGSAAVHAGVRSLLSGEAERVLVIGAEQMTHAAPDAVAAALLGADYDFAGSGNPAGFAGRFAEVAAAYEERYGPISDDLALIAAKNHRNGVKNPNAHLQRDLGVEFCRTVSDRNPIVAGVLRRTDCSPVSDGAAALVLTRERIHGAVTDPVRLLGWGQANDFLPVTHRDPTAFTATRLAVSRAMSRAGVLLGDLSFAELHDCFTIAELLLYEVIGLAPIGQGRRAIREGWVEQDGILPVNLSGGLKSKGHPVGATGVSQHIMAAQQLTGTAGDMQLPRADLALVQNMGGLGVANYAGVLAAW